MLLLAEQMLTPDGISGNPLRGFALGVKFRCVTVILYLGLVKSITAVNISALPSKNSLGQHAVFLGDLKCGGCSTKTRLFSLLGELLSLTIRTGTVGVDFDH